MNVDAIYFVNRAENTTLVEGYTVTDADAEDTVSWSLSGVDATLFDISENGELTFKSVPDFETPLGGANDDSNAYSVIVTATDSGNKSDSSETTVNVENVDEIPVLLVQDSEVGYKIADQISSIVVNENLNSVAFFDATSDFGDKHTYSLTGEDASLFNINDSGELVFISAPDYENPLHQVQLPLIQSILITMQ